MENLSVNPENYKILVVDDIATNVLLLKTILGKAGYRIVTATGGREALEKVESESPDLILLDIMMPDMNGYEVIERLKADERFCRIPVIFLSALHDSENIVKGFKMGASDYVSKPFNHEELITRVAHHMFIAEVVNVQADDCYLDKDSGKFELANADPLVYLHGGYFELGEKIGKFGWSVEKKRKKK